MAGTSPYRSRKITVETDGVTTVARLRNARDAIVGTVWIADHRPVHRPGTRHPEGRPALDPAALEVVWFEEGDGVAVLEDGEPLCVIPVWADPNRGVPGYSRDATAHGPHSMPLDEELAEFGPRIGRARAYWRWLAADGAWAGFRQAALEHLLGRLGPAGHYWPDVGRQWRGGAAPVPLVGVSERPPREGRGYSVLSTVGMSAQRMPTIELYEDDVSPFARIELAVATTLPSRRAGSVFPWLAQYPWRSVTWFAPGDVVQWYHEARTFPLNHPGPDGARWEGVLLLDEPGRLAGPVPPELSGFDVGGDPVRWLWLVPISDEERRFAKAEGSDALVRRLAGEGRGWVVE